MISFSFALYFSYMYTILYFHKKEERNTCHALCYNIKTLI